MPTGLTSRIYDGKDTSLRGFALQCVRQLGYGYYASDHGEAELPLDKAPVIKPNDYHRDELEKAKKQLKDFTDLQKDPNALRKMYEKEVKQVTKRDDTSKKEKEEIKKRYLSVLDKVEKWDAPNELDSLVQLMKNQLNDCIDFDCTIYESKQKQQTFEEWVESKIESLTWSIDYHTKEYAKDVKYAEECNEYMRKLYEELDRVDPLKK